MTAVGRLWRRAPAWRLSLLSALGLTALAVMFPPSLPRLPLPAHASRTAGADGAAFHPHPSAPAGTDAGGIINLPPPGPTRSGIVDFAGRQLPLPAGSWQTLAMASAGNGVQQLLLDRIVGGHLTGLVLATATGVFGGESGPIGVPHECADPGRLAGAIVPDLPGQSPLVHECWSIVPASMKDLAGGNGSPTIVDGLKRLGDRNIKVPDRMLAAQFMRSTDRGWQNLTVMVPDNGGTITALSGWASRYQALLHKGFDGTATPADLTQATIQTPP